MAKKERAGKEFERLVARIETILGPAGAVVTSPDYLIDQVTGSRREVDASIRVRVGDVEEITTVECRDYASAKQDDRWLEQLVTKREKLGVVRTIAVSSTGFTSAAITTASHYGIDLRRMDQITDAEIAKKWVDETVRFSFYYPSFVLDKLEVLSGNDRAVDISKLPSPFANDPTRTPFLRLNGGDGLVSAEDMFNECLEKCPWMSRDDEFAWPVFIENRGNGLHIATTEGDVPIKGIRLTYKVQKAKAKSNVESVKRYSSDSTTLMDQISSVADLSGTGIKMEFFGRLDKPLPESD